MYAMTAKKDNVVSIEDVKRSKLHAAMDQIGEDYHRWVDEQCDAHDLAYWTTTFSVRRTQSSTCRLLQRVMKKVRRAPRSCLPISMSTSERPLMASITPEEVTVKKLSDLVWDLRTRWEGSTTSSICWLAVVTTSILWRVAVISRGC